MSSYSHKNKQKHNEYLLIKVYKKLSLSDVHGLSHGLCLYQVMMTLHFLDDVANDANQHKNRKLHHNR